MVHVLYSELWVNFIWLFPSSGHMILNGKRAICLRYAVYQTLCISNWFSRQRSVHLPLLSSSFLSDISEDTFLWLSPYLSWTALSSCFRNLCVLSSCFSCLVGSILRHAVIKKIVLLYIVVKFVPLGVQWLVTGAEPLRVHLLYTLWWGNLSKTNMYLWWRNYTW